MLSPLSKRVSTMKYALRLSPSTQAFAAATFFDNRTAYRDLLSICEGMLADNEINPAEAAYLKKWLERNHGLYREWPFPDLLARLNRIFADGAASPEECSELTQVLQSLIGARVVHTDARLPGAGMAGPTQLIFDTPPPDVIFANREFCVTGVFAFARRGAVENEIKSRGGTTIKSPRKSTNYVLVGSFVSPGWANRNFGTKIEKALSLRENGSGIAIVGEEHWKTFLK